GWCAGRTAGSTSSRSRARSRAGPVDRRSAPLVAPAVVQAGLDAALAEDLEPGRVAVGAPVVDPADVGVDDHLGAHDAGRHGHEHDLALDLGAGLDQAV